MADDVFPDALPRHYRVHWYTLDKVLGQGGFGITYLARDTNLDRQVAIKEYLPVEVAQRAPDLTVRPRTEAHAERYRWGLERFIGEAQTLAHFDHPNIVRVLAVFEANGTAYMVMRFEEGENLGRLLEQRGTLPESELLRILLPILDGLELVHNARFIHRDIKPENIHIRRDGSPVLLDFGSARQYLHRTHTMTILVARGYAPLEQYSGGPDSQGAWSDIYSLAATCYRAIAGKAPADALERIKGVLGSVRDILPQAVDIGRVRYSERLLKAVDHALALNEKDRPQSIAEWRAEIVGDTPATAHAAQSTTATPAAPARAADAPRTATAVQSPQPPPRRSAMPWVIGVAAAVVIAIAIFAGMQYQQKLETQQRLAQQQAQQQQAEQMRLQQEEARKREADQARRDDEERRRLAAEQEAQKREADAARAKQPPAPRPQKREPAKTVTASPAPPAVAPSPAIGEPPKPAAVQVPRATEPETAVKPAPSEPAAKSNNAELLDRAEAAIGRGDYASALPVVKRLAAAGDARGQTLLGRLNEMGLGMPRNAMGAYMWYSLAAKGGNAAAAGMKERVAGKLQPAEIRQADHAVGNWRPSTE